MPLLVPGSGRLRALVPMFVGAMILSYDLFGPLAFYPIFACLLAIGAGWSLLSKS